MEIVFFWIILCFVAGAVGDKRKIGFAGAFFLSLFLSPLVGLIMAFNSDKVTVERKTIPQMSRLVADGDRLFRSKDYNDAIEKYLSALTYSDKAPVTNFKLAKLYSLKQDEDKSIYHLAKAVQQGFKNIQKINHDPELSYLRDSTLFKQFVENGYTLPTTSIEVRPSLSKIEELEKLNSLFEKGVLTSSEFQNEKKRILSRNS